MGSCLYHDSQKAHTMKFPRHSVILVLTCALILVPGCSIKKFALKKVATILSSEGGTVFTGDSDPQLVGDALPFALKMYESLLEGLPDDDNLLLATGKAFCMYGYAFVHAPADTISDMRIEHRTAQYLRAKRLYLRARGYLLRACDQRHPGFTSLVMSDNADSALALVTEADSSLLYWTAMSWMGAFTADKFDMSLAVSIPAPVAIMNHLLKTNEAYALGSVHDFFTSYYGGMPESMGGSESKAREHFTRALELNHGKRSGTYIALATSVCVGKQDAAEFSQLLHKALAINVDLDPGNRLANMIAGEKAAWLLAHIDDFFLTTESIGKGDR